MTGTGVIEISDGEIQELLSKQFPQWVGLPLHALGGWDNQSFRLGSELLLRFPRGSWASGQPTKDHEWLPWLAPQLPLTIPRPLALGTPSEVYPWAWGVYTWVPGQDASIALPTDAHAAARQLAAFLSALQHVDASLGPVAGESNYGRGLPLAHRDRRVREALIGLDQAIAKAAAASWVESLKAPEARHSAWLHGDLTPPNVLVRDGELTAVIDFGCMGVGDPACDYMIAWTLFSDESRETFRAALPDDDAAWLRGRGWALSEALRFLAGDGPEVLRARAQAVISTILENHRNT